MKKFIIIEDEPIAARRLKNLILELRPDSECEVMLDSVEAAVAWFSSHTFEGVICMDVQLADGICFDIFAQIEIFSPIIFTTAYDHFLVRAFEANALDYLLKPIKPEDMRKALDKLDKVENAHNSTHIQELMQDVQQQETVYIKRLLVKLGVSIRVVPIAEVAYFYTQNKVVFAALQSGRNYPIDFNLDELESTLNPSQFFRINRQLIISPESVTQMLMYTKSRLKLTLLPAFAEEVIVSYERCAAFKKWLTEN